MTAGLPRSLVRAVTSSAVAATLALLSAPAAGNLLPLGDEERLDGFAANGGVGCPAIASRPDGATVAAWMRFAYPDDPELAAKSRLPGGSWGPRQRVDGPPAYVSYLEGTAATDDGFVLLWRHFVVEPDGPSRYPHVAGSLDLDAALRGEPLDLARHAIFMSPRPVRGFVTYWHVGRTLNVLRVNAAGASVGRPFKIASADAFFDSEIVVAHAPDGAFVVGWNAYRVRDLLLIERGFWAQRFAADGRPLGRPTRLLAVSRRPPQLALAADGTLAMLTTETHGSLRNPSRATLRTFDAANRPLGPGFIAAPHAETPAHTFASSLAFGPAGRLLLVWVEYAVSGTYEPRLWAGLFDRGAEPLGDAVEVAAEGSPQPFGLCSAAAWAGDSWVVVRQGWSTDLADRSMALWGRLLADE